MAVLNEAFGARWLVDAAPVVAAAVAKATVVLALGCVCTMLARGTSAAVRHMLWTLALAGSIAVPAVAAVVPHWELPLELWPWLEQSPRAIASTSRAGIPPALTGPSSKVAFAPAPPSDRSDRATSPARRPSGVVRRQPSAAWPTAATGGGSGAAYVPALPPAVAPEPVSPGGPRGAPPGAWIVALWFIGLLIALLPTTLGMVRLRALSRRAHSMRGGRWALLVPSALREIGVRRRVRFLELDEPVMPMTWGVFRPVVLLPAGDFDSTVAQRLDVLRHELAHVRRYDCLTQLIGQLACAIYWFNPLAWIAARQLRVERERACDDEVLRVGAKASDYADYLLRVARSTRMTGVAALGGLAMARPSQLAGRLLAVLDDRRRRGRLSASAAVQAALATALVVAVIGALTPAPASARVAGWRRAGGVARRETVTIESNGIRVAPLALDAPQAAARASEAGVLPPLPPGAEPLGVAGGSARGLLQAVVTPAGRAECERKPRSGSTSHTNWTSSGNGLKRWRALWSDGDCSYEIEARGDVKFNGDATDVESISSGGSFTLEQHVGDDTRRLVIRPAAGGALERSYSVNGARHDYDDDARAWFAAALTALERQTAFAVEQRVPALLDRGGVDGVLREISLLGTDYARRRYYTRLLSMRQLDRTQVRRVVEQAGTEMSSDYELAELLVAVAKLDAFSDESHPAFVSAAAKIDSDYERRRALNALLRRDRLATGTVQALLDAASTIGSDYELAEFLIAIGKKGALDASTRDSYFAAADKIESDYEHRRALTPLLTRDLLTKDLARSILASAARIESDYECSTLLVTLAKAIPIDDDLRPAYERAAATIEGEYEHGQAMNAVRRRVTR